MSSTSVLRSVLSGRPPEKLKLGSFSASTSRRRADSGALFALMDRRDDWHRRVFDWFSATPDDVLVPVTTVPEVSWMLTCRVGPSAEAKFVRGVATGDFALEAVEPGDLARIADLVEIYVDLPLGFVDASIVAMPERLGISAVLTTDRRDFGVVRPAHVPRLRLLP